jgi:hypothetical protein
MNTATCQHRVDASLCPACAQEQRDAWEADRLAARDKITRDRWVEQFDRWILGSDFRKCLEAR